MSISLDTERRRVIAKLEALSHERAPSMILDKCDADLLLGYIRTLEGWVEACEDDPS